MTTSGKKLFLIKSSFQILLFIFSILLIAEGLWGTNFAPKNLTTLFVWVHYRGLLVIILLLFGNFFCMSCPFIFTRNALRVFVTPKKLWPKIMQNKWAGIVLFVGVLFCYEYFNLWSAPVYTAYLIIAYFLIAIAIDLTFKHASFCKYLCPIGQFNFISSTLSPKVVSAKKLSVCDSCTTYECIKGTPTKRGCETHLFMPKKNGNLDCTFCMDCVFACPHDNISVLSVTPTEELWGKKHRSGIGDLYKRSDILFLIIIFTFAGLLNAFAMVGPAHDFKEFLSNVFQIQNELLSLSLLFILFLFLIPMVIIPKRQPQLIPTLIPIGFSIWCAHYSFHLLTGIFTFIPLLFKVSIPTHLMGVPLKIVTPIQYGLLVLGFLASVTITAIQDQPKRTKFSWFFVHAVLLVAAIWIMSLPMEMRGTFIGFAP